MTGKTAVGRALLDAFVDGELSPEDAAQVVIHLADHPDDQAYVDNLMSANEYLAQSFGAPLHEPVPAALRARIMGRSEPATVIPFRRRPIGWVVALAAAVTGVAVLTLQPVPGERLSVGPVADSGMIETALNTLASGVPQEIGRATDLMILATLPVTDGFCREIEVIDRTAERLELGLACKRQDDGWIVEAVLSEPLSASASDGFAPAGGTELQGLQPFLDRAGAGAALQPAAEAMLMADGWNP